MNSYKFMSKNKLNKIKRDIFYYKEKLNGRSIEYYCYDPQHIYTDDFSNKEIVYVALEPIEFRQNYSYYPSKTIKDLIRIKAYNLNENRIEILEILKKTIDTLIDISYYESDFIGSGDDHANGYFYWSLI